MKKVAIITILIVLIDQVSKFYIKTNFGLGESMTVFEDWFQIVFVENPGMAYGMHWGGIFGKIALAVLRWVLIGFGVWFIFKNQFKYQSNYFYISMGLILAGALGNVIDSTFYGLIFDSGTTWNEDLQSWNRYYDGVSKANFEGYAPLFQGCVVDMLHLPFFDYTWPDWVPMVGGESGTFFAPVFNIADSAITVGGFILLIFKDKVFREYP
ncbi:lipoprotein signal peptidase [Flavobacteriaceae bacterium Ap0902]|nr:lipoprotein signal peptidase [Flavobacteriaceae bacterium Ap0902]